MAANLAGIAASQVFRTADAPYYPIGFTACLVLSGVNMVEVIALGVWYFWGNKKLAKEDRVAHIIHAQTPQIPPLHLPLTTLDLALRLAILPKRSLEHVAY